MLTLILGILTLKSILKKLHGVHMNLLYPHSLGMNVGLHFRTIFIDQGLSLLWIKTVMILIQRYLGSSVVLH